MKNKVEMNYDLSELQVISVDGALVKITEYGGSLLFFHFLPAISSKPELDDNASFVGKCVVELRMSKSTLSKMIHDITKNISMFESGNQPQTSIQKDAPSSMFV
jgi:hypothetical protein